MNNYDSPESFIMNDFYYKSMCWYELLGFDKNEENKKRRRGEYWSTDEIEKKYHSCLALLNHGNLSEVNSFYQKQLPSESLENLSELRGKIQLAYNTLINPEKRKEYDLEVFGIFHYDYAEEEIADEKFKVKAINNLESFLQDEWDEELGYSYWKNYLSSYWQNWREIIKKAKYKEEIKFFLSRFFKLRMFILERTGWGKKGESYTNAFELIKQEKIRLQNITKEEWDKELEKNKMSEKDIEWVTSELKKVLKGENDKKTPNAGTSNTGNQSTNPILNNNFQPEENHNTMPIIILFLIIIGGCGLIFIVKKKK